MTEIELAYIAGFFDGEGSIGIYEGKRNSFRLLVQISQNASEESEQLLDSMVQRWGGSLHHGEKSLSGRPFLLYQVQSAKALGVLTAIRPYLREKAEQADLAIEWQTGREPWRVRGANGCILPRPEECNVADRLVAQRLKALKHT